MNHSRSDEIVHECQLDHPRDRVWHAVTTPGLLAQWIGFAPGAVSDGDDTSGYPLRALSSWSGDCGAGTGSGCVP